jgi:hypothetical protein
MFQYYLYCFDLNGKYQVQQGPWRIHGWLTRFWEEINQLMI